MVRFRLGDIVKISKNTHCYNDPEFSHIKDKEGVVFEIDSSVEDWNYPIAVAFIDADMSEYMCRENELKLVRRKNAV